MKLAGLRVTVAGAGIGGAASALLFARAGAEVTVVERVGDPMAVGAGIALQPNGLAVLYGLGLRAALCDRAFVGRAGVIRGQDGRALVSTTLPDFGNGLDHFVALRRSHLFAVLVDAISSTPGIDLRLGEPVVSVDRDATAVLQGGDTIVGDLFVGADGAHSIAREALQLGTAARAPETQYLRAIVDAPAITEVSETWTELGLFGSAPVGDGTYLFCDAGSPPMRAALARSDLGSVLDAWSVFPPGRALLERVPSFDDLLVNDVVTVHCEAFHVGSSALLGDAAHAMAPNTGQGANSALVDAAVLVASVRAADDVPGALDAYTRRRHRKVAYVQQLSGRLARLAGVRSRPGRRVRDLVLRATAPVARSRRQVDRLMQEPPSALLALASDEPETR